MPYRICKIFEIESGHMLSKHPDLCRYPHGHSRKIEVTISSDKLNQADMVCDFKLIKILAQEFLASFDHAMAINSNDPMKSILEESGQRLVIFNNTDPTTEIIAKHIFEYLQEKIHQKNLENAQDSNQPKNLVTLEKIRVWETSSSWAEYTL